MKIDRSLEQYVYSKCIDNDTGGAFLNESVIRKPYLDRMLAGNQHWLQDQADRSTDKWA